MLQVGLTGGIGAGKSFVAAKFKQLGIPVYESDARAKWLMQHDIALKKELQALFGKQVFKNDVLQTKEIAAQVFTDSAKLEKLNALVHPCVGQDYQDWLKSQIEVPYVLKEAAILIESGTYKHLDKLIVVDAPEDLRLERSMKRDKQEAEAIHNRMKKQMNSEQRNAYADFIILNDGNQNVDEQVKKVHQLLIQETKNF